MRLEHEKRLLDGSAFAELFQRAAPPLFSYLRTHLPVPEDAEDVLLEVFTAALGNARFAGMREGEQLAWLRAVAGHKVSDYYRRAKRYPVVGLEQIEAGKHEDEAMGPEQLALQAEEHMRLWVALQQLPTEQQELLRLCFAEGLPFAEIARRVGKSEGSVRVRVSRILNVLRELCWEA